MLSLFTAVGRTANHLPKPSLVASTHPAEACHQKPAALHTTVERAKTGAFLRYSQLLIWPSWMIGMTLFILKAVAAWF